MKFALCNELFEAWNTDRGFDFPRVFECVKKSGYDGMEIAPFTIAKDAFHISSTRRAEIRRLAQKNDLAITGLHWLLAKTEGYYLTSPEPAVRQKTADYLIELIRLCADIEGSFMVLGSPMQRSLLPDVTHDQAFDYVADVLQKVIPMLEQSHVQIALEPLSPKETNFLTTAAETVRLIEKIGVPNQIALHLDCKAMISESLPIPDLIRANKEHLIYFHLNDPNLQGPGFGELDFVPIMRALHEIGYNGWASVEVFDYSPGIENLAEKSLAYTKKCHEKGSQR
ncbi:MAG: sugar phosphate isomerase/epimerase [Planctomycetaceae bacterium]|jgi:sugar phosphate isomerase/epimerase|nr:sugar phosphate isomerase/epimerase [Planctomycetaceae bacterium]